MRLLIVALLGLFASCLLARPAHAAESNASCTNYFSMNPTTINAPGVWCFSGTFNANSTANPIVIASDKVTVDCLDSILLGPGSSSGTGIGISSVNHSNITIRHCNVQGFRTGVSLRGGGGHLVEDNVLSGNQWIGIRADGDGTIVRRNRVIQTGGTTTATNYYGIYSSGSANISDNIVSSVRANTGNVNAYGIYTTNNLYGSIDHNTISGLIAKGTGTIVGIYNGLSGQLAVRDNDVLGLDYTIGGMAGVTPVFPNSVGVSCANSTGRAKNNIINGFTTPLKTCGGLGDNATSP